MYLAKVEVKSSEINGKGVFSLQKINKGEIVWKYDQRHDVSRSKGEFEAFSEEIRLNLERVAYLSAVSNRYVYPPENDPALFTNHSKSNNLTAVIDLDISEEPYFVANRDIEVGEELTNNYSEFDEKLKSFRLNWI